MSRVVEINKNSILVLVLIIACPVLWLFLAKNGNLGVFESIALDAGQNQLVGYQSSFGKSLGFLGTTGLTFFFTLPVFFISVLNRRGRVIVGLVTAALFLLYAVSVSELELRTGLVFPLLVPLGSALSAAAIIFLFRLNQEEKKRRRLQALFASYLSPELVQKLLESDKNPQIGGSEVRISILFSDIENFSSIAHELRPDQLVEFMSIYLNAMAEVLQANNATLDKFVGDGIVAMFGMPVELPNHAAMACEAALQMQERCAALREEFQASGSWPAGASCLRNRIGVHTGMAVVGNLGSVNRFNYTMIGESVNVASRCEAIAKKYGIYTLVTLETLQDACKELPNLQYRKIDRVNFRGRYEPVELYELWDSSIDHKKAEDCKVVYEAAFEAYTKGDFVEALKGFQRAESLEPLLTSSARTPSSVLAVRCQKFLKIGAPPNWSGVHFIS